MAHETTECVWKTPELSLRHALGVWFFDPQGLVEDTLQKYSPRGCFFIRGAQ